MAQNPREAVGSTQISYTVEQALHLIRQLPLERMNEELIVKVIRATLENVGVSIPALLEAAAQQQDAITNEIVRLQSDIVSLQQAIEQKSSQVATYQSQLAELSSLRERFAS